MPEVEIRPVTPEDDFEAQVDLGQRAFGIYSPAQRASWLYAARLRAAQGLFLGAFEGGQPAGAAMVHDMRQWWAGRAVSCAGVASVKVAPEHRGQGIGRRLMTELLGLIAERGYPLSALFPATMPIYRSLGWELAGGRYDATVPARSLRTLMPPDPAASAASSANTPGVRRATPADAAAVVEIIGRAHEAARDGGPITWDVPLAGRWLAGEDLYAYLTGDGIAAYRWADGNETLLVERVQAASPQSLRDLWSVIASHGSTVATIRTRVAPNGPLWWLTHERDAAIAKRSLWMLRVVDAPGAIAARGFPPAVTLSLPLVISDHARPANSGHWQLSVSDGKGILIQNEPVTSPATTPLALGARGLAALYAGTPVSTLRLAGLVSGGTPDADAALDAAFAATPYMLDSF
ncbi:MAG: GNAT family N-acetyltransferase [Pseudonocardia sp.]|nr:GNAT family N-acetyltransferase [Pseudonocardia sp.]